MLLGPFELAAASFSCPSLAYPRPEKRQRLQNADDFSGLFFWFAWTMQCLADSKAMVSFYMDIQQYFWHVGKDGYTYGITV